MTTPEEYNYKGHKLIAIKEKNGCEGCFFDSFKSCHNPRKEWGLPSCTTNFPDGIIFIKK
jgi:hypothetical protein